MTEGEKAVSTSSEDRYDKARKEKPELSKFVDSIRFRGPYIREITNKDRVEQLQEVIRFQKLKFLELCKKDVRLNEDQAVVVRDVLSKAIKVKEEEDMILGESIFSEEHPELMLIAATYINSL